MVLNLRPVSNIMRKRREKGEIDRERERGRGRNSQE
jgi:hypothetical protein